MLAALLRLSRGLSGVPSIEKTLLAELSSSPDDARTALATQIRVMVLAQPRILGAGIVASLLMAGTMWYGAPEPKGANAWLPWLWMILLSLGLGRGIRISLPLRTHMLTIDETLHVARRLAWNGLYCSALWGASSWLMLPHPNFSAVMFLVIATAMVLMGGSASQAVYRPLLVVFVIPATGIFALGLLRMEVWELRILAIAFPLLAFVILSAARLQEEAVRVAILLRVKTEKLLEEKIEQQALTEKAREEAEASRAEAERANQGKTAFLAAAGHDLRQPMHALTLYHGHLRRKNRDPELQDTVDRIGKSIDAMQDLLDSILQVSKLMMGAVKPTICSFPITQVLDRLDAQLRPIAEDKGLVLEVDGSPAFVETDEVLLERVLRNLVLNAIRYTNAGRVLVRCKPAGKMLSVQVWDTGIGIRRGDLDHIFDEFYQVENEARDRKKGLGLGLSIVRHLCSLLSIHLRVRSTFGQGSVFLVQVPVSSQARPRPLQPERERPDYIKGTFVVLIDDNEDSLEAMRRSLEEFGSQVLAARSGLEAIERLQGQEFMPHLIVSDYRLGEGQTGIDAIRMVTENQQALYGEEFHIPALVVSGDTAPNELLRVQEAGYPMLHKPVKLDVLYREINNQLEKLAREGNTVC